MKGTTKTGFAYDLSEERLKNARFLDALRAIDQGKFWLVGQAAELMLGEKQKEALYSYLEDENGIVPIDKLTDELMEMLQGGETGKN